MAMDNAQWKEEYRKRKTEGEEVRLTLIVSACARSQLVNVARRCGVSKREILERLLYEKDVSAPSTHKLAIKLFARCHGDLRLAKEFYRNKLREQYPGFTVNGHDVRKDSPFYEGRKLYSRMCRHLESLSRTDTVAGQVKEFPRRMKTSIEHVL